ncbi:hypothetical protein BH11BAC1_BH11BAC1_12360 [soil metagenome]
MKTKKKSTALPGYPRYPASEDILNQNAEKIDVDPDNIPPNPTEIDLKSAIKKGQPLKKMVKRKLESEADVNQNDLAALGDLNLSMDIDDEDDELRNHIYPVDMSASELDIPGSELDDENESIGSEDEENNFYSLGGDEHD